MEISQSTDSLDVNGSLSYCTRHCIAGLSSTGNYIYGPDYMTSLVVSSTTQFTRNGSFTSFRILLSAGTGTGIGKMKAVKIA